MIDWSSCAAIEGDPQRVCGAWVFRGTRVPVESLFQNLKDGANVSDFVRSFPGVTAEHIRVALEQAVRSLHVE